jgi:hypothetical protein
MSNHMEPQTMLASDRDLLNQLYTSKREDRSRNNKMSRNLQIFIHTFMQFWDDAM